MTLENVKTKLEQVLQRLQDNNSSFETLNYKIWNEGVTGQTKELAATDTWGAGYLQEIEVLLSYISDNLDVYEAEINRLEVKLYEPKIAVSVEN